MKKMEFGWWYVKYACAMDGWTAFGIWENEYKLQFPEYDMSDGVEMLELYSDWYSNGLMPNGFIVSAIDAIAYLLFRFRRIFCCLLILKHRISYRMSKILNKQKTEIISIDVSDWE